MKRYSETLTIYEGMAKSFFFIEAADNQELNSFVEEYREYIILRLKHEGIDVAGFNIVSPAKAGINTIKELILRQQPTLDSETLEKRAGTLKNKAGKGKLLFVNSAGYDYEGGFEADIICEDDFGSSIPEYTARLDNILEAITEYHSREKRLGTTRYRQHLPDDDGILKRDDNKECLCNDLLAESICDAEYTAISPILFDENFNMSLPLYPQVEITLEPLPKALYILFLHHPEGILLKDIYLYEDELKKIYSLVSGRRNPTVINRMFRSLVDPTEAPLHKNLSIIRRCFTSKLNYNIARNYIPAHGRRKAHNIPLESDFVILPETI